MTTATIESRVFQVISEQLEIPIDQISAEHRIGPDLPGDSLDAIEIVMMLEEEFQIDLPDELGDPGMTVQKLIDCVKEVLEL